MRGRQHRRELAGRDGSHRCRCCLLPLPPSVCAHLAVPVPTGRVGAGQHRVGHPVLQAGRHAGMLAVAPTQPGAGSHRAALPPANHLEHSATQRSAAQRSTERHTLTPLSTLPLCRLLARAPSTVRKVGLRSLSMVPGSWLVTFFPNSSSTSGCRGRQGGDRGGTGSVGQRQHRQGSWWAGCSAAVDQAGAWWVGRQRRREAVAARQSSSGAPPPPSAAAAAGPAPCPSAWRRPCGRKSTSGRKPGQ